MKAALEFSEESKCAAKKVACIIVKDNSIIAIGVNGSAPKSTNCCDLFKKQDGKWFRAQNPMARNESDNESYSDNKTWVLCDDQRKHFRWSAEHETHAEINALARAGTNARGAFAYITYSPCLDCVKALGAFGISKVYYHREFDNLELTEMTLRRYGATIEKLII
jgi:dCMP deaminase